MTLPDSFSAAAVGAVVAALAYVGRLLVEAFLRWRQERRARRARLVALQSLLRATRVAFLVQRGHAVRLLDVILESRGSEVDTSRGFERAFAQAWPTFTADERELHGIIRGITVHSLRPANRALSDWLAADAFFKAHERTHRRFGALARLLAELDAHLILWHAKYETWIPDHPAHALVYLADEEGHGVGFPVGIDEEVARVLA